MNKKKVLLAFIPKYGILLYANICFAFRHFYPYVHRISKYKLTYIAPILIFVGITFLFFERFALKAEEKVKVISDGKIEYLLINGIGTLYYFVFLILMIWVR